MKIDKYTCDLHLIDVNIRYTCGKKEYEIYLFLNFKATLTFILPRSLFQEPNDDDDEFYIVI